VLSEASFHTNFSEENPTPLKGVIKPPVRFKTTYADANFFSKVLFHYAGTMIEAVNQNGGTMQDDILISMC
jgi:hypothetical protein